MTTSRRELFRFSKIALAAIPLRFIQGAGTETPAGARGPLFTKARFQPLVNSSFAVRSAGSTHSWLTLLSVEDVPPFSFGSEQLDVPRPRPHVQARAENFILHFCGSGEPLSQGAYDLEHTVLGRFSLFVVPAGVDRYTAVINRLTGPEAALEPPRRIQRPVAPAGPENR